MPRKIVFLCFLLNLSSLFAQYRSFLGIEGGAGLALLRGNKIAESVLRPGPGFAGGITYEYTFSKLFSFRTALSYERKNCQANFVFANNTGVFTTKTVFQFDYAVLPLLLRLKLGESIKFTAQAGPFAGYLLRQQEVSTSSNFGKQKTVLTANYLPFDFGLSLGLGLLVPLTKNISLTGEFRGNLGLYNISRLPVYDNESIKTSSALVLAGLVYNLDRR